MAPDRIFDNTEVLSAILKRYKALGNFSGAPADFWPAYLEALIDLLDAIVGTVIVRSTDEQPAWRQLAFAPQNQKSGFYAKIMAEKLEELSSLCQIERSAILEAGGIFLLAVRVALGEDNQECLAVLCLKETVRSHAATKLSWLQFCSDIPQAYQSGRIAHVSKIKVEQLTGALDFLTLIAAPKKFMASAMVFTNEIATRLGCDRVSLGWINKGYIRLEAMSHVDHFERKMERVRQIEAAMEESFDQNSEVILPAAAGSDVIDRAHQEYAQAQSIGYICTFPLRVNDEPAGVCLCERGSKAFSDTELGLARLLCDHASVKLSDLKLSDRWWGSRFAATLRKSAGKLVGCEYTWAKVVGLLVAAILAFVCFVPIPFRVEAPLILRTKTLSYLTAAFDGHIDSVLVRVGDIIKEGDVLLTFDKKSMLLEEDSLAAEEARYQREFEKARSASVLAEMRVAEALRDQAIAQLASVRYRINHAVICAPFDGVVVEGDMNERIGAPVKQGDILFKAARKEGMYAELEVSESDIHYVSNGYSGEIALVSRPQDSYKVKVKLVEPAAVAKDKGNIFILHADFAEDVPSWWQPGMTGVGKINAGKRVLLWILTRRTIDFLRLRLWW